MISARLSRGLFANALGSRFMSIGDDGGGTALSGVIGADEMCEWLDEGGSIG